MLRTHIASFVIGTVLVGGGAGAATVTQFSGRADVSVDAGVEDHLQTAEDAFARAQALVDEAGEEAMAQAEALYAEGTGNLLEATADADAHATAGSDTSLSTMDLLARTSAELATRFTTSTGAQAERLSGVKGQLVEAIDKQVATTQKLAADKRAEVLAVLEGAKADLAGAATSTATVSTGGASSSSTGNQVAASGQARSQARVSGGSLSGGSVPAPTPAPAQTTTETPSASADAQAEGQGDISIRGLLPRP